jgi:homoserine kinase type II
MAVFTNLTELDINQILSGYEISSLISFEGIAEGVENTNYKIQTNQNSYILTIYEKRVDPNDLPFFIDLQKSLRDMGFACPKPIANKNNNFIGEIAGKKYTIVSFLSGKWKKELTVEDVSKAGEMLAKFHNITSNLPKEKFNRPNSMSIEFWRNTYNAVKIQAEEKFPKLKEAISDAYEIIDLSWPQNLPKAVIHADYFPDNVLFDNGEVSGVIDFYMSCQDFLAYDLAIALNSWCFEPDFSFNLTKSKALLAAYNKVRKLTKDEIKNFRILCIGGSLRFLSSRAYDYFNRQQNAIVNVKDPAEYIAKLRFHLNVKSYNEYGL